MEATNPGRRQPRLFSFWGLITVMVCGAFWYGPNASACRPPYTGQVVAHLSEADLGTRHVFLVPKSTRAVETTHEAIIEDGQPVVFDCLASGTYTLSAGKLSVEVVVGTPQ